jgi:hypothetical protein
MLLHSRPGSRLITQNLLTSARVYETGESMDRASISDLCALIDLFCLYDEVVVLGREASPYILGKGGSEIFSILSEAEFVHVDDLKSTMSETTVKKISESARGHLRAFLADSDDIEDYEGLIRPCLEPSEVAYGLSPIPDRGRDFETVLAWIHRTPSHNDILNELKNQSNFVRSYTFIVRTFLYLAYSNIQNLTFTPDATRVGMLEQIIDTEQHLRKKLLSLLREVSKRNLVSQHFEISITPFAAVVFDRAKHKRDIPREMERLRKELAPLRERLRDAEGATWGSLSDEQNAEQEWDRVFAEIERTFGKGGELLSVRKVLNFAGTQGDLLDEPHKKGKWIKTVLALPLDTILRIIDRQPAVEIHRLKKDIPGTDKLTMKLNLFFPDANWDED